MSKDPALPEKIIEFLRERTADEETGCVQLLICKTAPFLWGMQEALNEKMAKGDQISGAGGMFKHLPSKKEVEDYGDICETKFPACVLH